MLVAINEFAITDGLVGKTALHLQRSFQPRCRLYDCDKRIIGCSGVIGLGSS